MKTEVMGILLRPAMRGFGRASRLGSLYRETDCGGAPWGNPAPESSTVRGRFGPNRREWEREASFSCDWGRDKKAAAQCRGAFNLLRSA